MCAYLASMTTLTNGCNSARGIVVITTFGGILVYCTRCYTNIQNFKSVLQIYVNLWREKAYLSRRIA